MAGNNGPVRSYYGPRTEVVRYGPEVPSENELHLLGDVKGLRILELGSGSRSSAVPLAKQGAYVIVVDPRPERIAETRVLAEDEEVKVEWHEGDLADLAFLRADSTDTAFSAGAVLEVADVSRLFRQVHRVLKPGGDFVFAYEHPAALVARGRSYFDETPIPQEVDGLRIEQYPRPISDVYMALVRSGFRIEVIAEPRPLIGEAAHPTTLIWRARKEGM